MKTQLFWVLAWPAAVSLAGAPGRADEGRDNATDKAALAKRGEQFVEAFHNGDARGLAALWVPDGDYTPQTGRALKGREAIEEAFNDFFDEHKGLKLRVNSDSLRFLTPDVAVEDGTTEVIPPDGGPPSRARYTIVHVKKDGGWLLGSVRDAAFAPATNYEDLRGLEWAVGEWADEKSDSGEVARVSFAWAENQNFLVSEYATAFKNLTLAGGTQWIGWDPLGKRIRSWTFDSDGGFGEGAWTRDGDRWTIKTTSVLRDGKKVSATNVVTRVDADTITWQSTDRTV